LILIAFALFRPDFVMDRIQPPFAQIEPAGFTTALSAAEEGAELRLVVSGPDFDTGETKETTLVLPVGAGSGEGFDFYGDDPVQIASVQAPSNQMPKELVFIPALICLLLVAFLQRARMSRQGVPA